MYIYTYRVNPSTVCQVFEAGFKAHSVSPTSDGLGLDSAAVAIKAAGGFVWLTTSTDGFGDHTHFQIELPLPPDTVMRLQPCAAPAEVPDTMAKVRPPVSIYITYIYIYT